MWSSTPHRFALLELWSTGLLPRRKSQSEAFDELLRLGWGRRATRQDELQIDEARRLYIEALLDRVWPDWSTTLAMLDHEGLTPDERGWREFERRRRAAEIDLDALPERLNRRSATAMVARHSKSTLTPAHRETLGSLELTYDGLVRLRPHPGMELRRAELTLDAHQVATLTGELTITERALADGTRLCGPSPRALLLVENRGPFIDLPHPPGWLIAHVPGWDTRTIAQLLNHYPAIPVLHFGDLDPMGVQITRHLRTLHPTLRWFVPEFWTDYLETHAQPRHWPPDFPTHDLPPLVQTLITRNLWLEQELPALDPRLTTALEASLEASA
ncbi:MAG: hypothetical protein H0U74_00550 [Bradymonadaceae bacterium]|nr:hypothetical protein [Lujinxingiaceae bacterium]